MKSGSETPMITGMEECKWKREKNKAMYNIGSLEFVKMKINHF